MRKIILSLLFLMLMFAIPAFAADREAPSYAVKTSSGLIKQGDWKIYRIDFTATTNGGNFAIYDELTPATEANIKTEGREATANNGKVYDFSNKPLEGSTGLYLVINTAEVVIQYR